MGEILYSELIKNLIKDINKLEEELLKLKNDKDKAKLLKDASQDIESVIEKKQLFIEIDSSLIEPFNILKFFKLKENLDNMLAQDAFIKIINSEKIKDIINILNDIDLQIESIETKIKLIKDVIDFNAPAKTIIEFARSHSLEDDKIKEILFYGLNKKILNIHGQNEEIQIKEEPIIDIKEESEQEQTISALNLLEEMVKESEKDSAKIYREIKEKFDMLQSENKEIFNKYHELLKESKNAYSSYSNYSVKQLTEMGMSIEEIALIISNKLFSFKNEVSDAIKEINNNLIENDEDKIKDSCDYAIYCIEEYESILSLLLELDRVSISNEREEIKEIENSNVYFAHDNSGVPLMPLNEEYIKKIEIFVNKINSINSDNISLNIRKLLGAETTAKELGKNIYLVKSNPAITYVRLNYDNQSVVFILTMSKIEEIDTTTNQIVSDNLEAIKNQMSLIELNDSNEMEIQSSIRNMINPNSNMGIGR